MTAREIHTQVCRLIGYVFDINNGWQWDVRRDGRRWVVRLTLEGRSFAYATRDLSLGAVETVVRRMHKASARAR